MIRDAIAKSYTMDRKTKSRQQKWKTFNRPFMEFVERSISIEDLQRSSIKRWGLPKDSIAKRLQKIAYTEKTFKISPIDIHKIFYTRKIWGRSSTGGCIYIFVKDWRIFKKRSPRQYSTEVRSTSVNQIPSEDHL